MINKLKNKSVLIFLAASEFNEEEFLTIKNGLEKAGFQIFIASDAHTLCSGNKGLKVKPDVSLYNVNENNFGGIILIGGKGIRNYWDNKNLHVIAARFYNTHKVVGAICSAPVLLAKAGLLDNMEVSCFQEDKNALEREGAVYKDLPVVEHKNIITGSGPSAALDFTSAYVKKFDL